MSDHENVELLNKLFGEDRFAGTLGVELTDWSGGTATAVTFRTTNWHFSPDAWTSGRPPTSRNPPGSQPPTPENT